MKSTSIECRLLDEIVDDAAAFAPSSAHPVRYGKSEASVRLVPEVVDNAAQRIVIHSARYGAGQNWTDVTERIAELILRGNARIVVNNNLCQDPFPGALKQLIVDYAVRGQRQQKTILENDSFEPSTADAQEAATTKHRAILRADLWRYSDIARYLEQSLGPTAGAQLDEQIQQLIRQAVAAVGQRPKHVLLRTEGDSAFLAFETAEIASRCAEALYRAAESYNRGKNLELSQRHFRIGICSGDIVLEERTTRAGEFLGFHFAGIVIADAVRLEAACRTGEVLIDSDTWAELPEETRKWYGAEEVVAGKRDEKIRAHRRKVIEPSPWDRPAAAPAAAPPSPSALPTSPAVLLTEKLMRDEVGLLWSDVLGKSMEDEMPRRSVAECVVELLSRAGKRGKLAELRAVLGRIRSDIELPGSF